LVPPWSEKEASFLMEKQINRKKIGSPNEFRKVKFLTGQKCRRKRGGE